MDDIWDKARRLAVEQFPDSSPDLSSIEEIRIVERGSDRQLIDIDASENLLTINLDALDPEDYREVLDGLVTAFEAQNRLFSGEPNKVRSVTREALNNEQVRNSVNAFADYLDGPHLILVEKSLVANQGQLIERLPTERGDSIKEDIASSFEDHVTGADFEHGITAIHLASTEHLTADGTVISILEQLDEPAVDAHRIFMTILKENPFLVMVGRRSQNKVDELVDTFKDKLHQADQYQFNVEFVEGHAAGGSNRQTLEEVILTVQREALTLNYDCTVRYGETIYRLYPGSWQGDRN
jgi:hypothetical protein